MVILLQINKKLLEKSLHESEPGQNFNRKCCFLKKFHGFSLPGGNSIWKSWEESGQIALPKIGYISCNTISQIWNTWIVKIAHFITIFNLS